MSYKPETTLDQATFLLAEGMRIVLVQSITGMPQRQLSKIKSAYHDTDIPAARLPTSVASFIKAGQSTMILSSLVSTFLATKGQESEVAAGFISAWKAAKLCAGSQQIDINAAWYAVRDVKAGEIAWAKCNECLAGFMPDLFSAKTADCCPYCGTKNNLKLVGVSN